MTYAAEDIAAAVGRGLNAAGDRAQPGDVGRTPEKYSILSRNFRASAWKHLQEDGDLPQASNKTWGMVAETVKAVSARHGGIIHQHRSIWAVVRQLSRMVGDAGDDSAQAWINNSFMVARSLHSNFYEDEADEAEVTAGLELCEELSDKLYELFWPEGRAEPQTTFDG